MQAPWGGHREIAAYLLASHMTCAATTAPPLHLGCILRRKESRHVDQPLVLYGLSRAQGPGPQSPLAPKAALGTAFTYQGQLESGGSLISGNCDFQFALYNAASGRTQIGTTQTASNVAVTNGLFTVAIDFGSVFNGDARWRCRACTRNRTLPVQM
jgi:hypothetical protein